MTRRCAAHDYTAPGIYHITLHVADALGHPPGAVVGSLAAPVFSASAPLVGSAFGSSAPASLADPASTSAWPVVCSSSALGRTSTGARTNKSPSSSARR